MTKYIDENDPLPSTQDKFNEAYYFFIKMIENYHNPWEFQFNLNAFIQAFRNITFMLQAEKNKPDTFDKWYSNKQDEMRSIPILKKLVHARNIVVKQSSLSSKSKASLGLFRGNKEKLIIIQDINPFQDIKELLKITEKLMIGFILDEEHSAIGEQLGVKRVWIVDELGEEEVSLLCQNALNYMGKLISEAKKLYGLDEEFKEINVNTSQTQILLETDIDPSLIQKWGWGDI